MQNSLIHWCCLNCSTFSGWNRFRFIDSLSPFQFLEPMLTLIGKEEISDDELLKCQQIIYNLIAFEARHEPLTLPLGQNRYIQAIRIKKRKSNDWICFIKPISDLKDRRKMTNTNCCGRNWFTCYKLVHNRRITRNSWHSSKMKMCRTQTKNQNVCQHKWRTRRCLHQAQVTTHWVKRKHNSCCRPQEIGALKADLLNKILSLQNGLMWNKENKIMNSVVFDNLSIELMPFFTFLQIFVRNSSGRRQGFEQKTARFCRPFVNTVWENCKTLSKS